jgi:hypothetical protein
MRQSWIALAKHGGLARLLDVTKSRILEQRLSIAASTALFLMMASSLT